MKRNFSASIVLLVATLAACDQANTAEPPNAKPVPEQPGSGTAAASVTADGQPVNAMGAATLEFQKRVQAYMKIHNEAEGKVPNLKKTDDPMEIA